MFRFLGFFVFWVVSSLTVSGLCAQAAGTSGGASLPSALDPQQPASSQRPADSPAGTGTIYGTVLDTTGAVVQGATVDLTGPAQQHTRVARSGSNGEFAFAGLAPGAYVVTATSPGLSKFVSPPIQVKAENVKQAPNVVLSVAAAATTITVTGDDKAQLSEQQVQIAVQQRMLGGMLPNFFTSFDRDAPPMLPKQKLDLSVRSLLDPVTFLEEAGIAGAEQYQGIFPAYGSGIKGYGKRYGAAFANHAAGRLFGDAVYPSIFRQDPRYFYKGQGSFASRAFYAVSSAVIARGDNGRRQPNYSGVLGNFTAGAISNLYYPREDRGGMLVLYNGLADIGADAVGNLFREFVFNKLTERKH